MAATTGEHYAEHFLPPAGVGRLMLALADAPFAEREAVLHPLHRAAQRWSCTGTGGIVIEGIVLDCAGEVQPPACR